ncbi:MAG: tyrosine-type recombinase/integrase [Gemmatimonadetes bacterium]|nr:tyrosine-type recombinase/integrase [Gemmatimonadota bacterium]MBT6145920.1 tyrosine-type recombinase/integrase [Gemmatimonadota bacterium]MBT7859205.1 tyrosine-type recombinase/integrase [Gemmatimonadota bacterium]
MAQFLSGQLTERTKKAYYSDLCEFFNGDRIRPEDVQAVDFADIIEYRNALAAMGRKRTTINRKLSSLKAFFKMMIAADIIDKNPADSALVRGYRVDDTVSGKALKKRDLQRILDTAAAEEDDLRRSRDLAILHLLTFAGLRRSELAGMDWDDLDQEGVFQILRLPDTKSGVTQDVKLQPVVLQYLFAYRDTLELQGYSLTGKAFISLSRNESHGQPITPQSINLIAKRYARLAGITRPVTAHMFRHTCCTLSIEGGAKPQQVQAHLRHKDLKTTMLYYENRERLSDNASDYIHIKS